jgi:hypothetical protein
MIEIVAGLGTAAMLLLRKGPAPIEGHVTLGDERRYQMPLSGEGSSSSGATPGAEPYVMPDVRPGDYLEDTSS